MMEDLEDRERAFKKQKENRQKEQQDKYHEAERAKGEGKRMMEERLAEMKAMEEQRAAESSKEEEETLPPTIGMFCLSVLQGRLTDLFSRATGYHHSTQIHPCLSSRTHHCVFINQASCAIRKYR